MKFSNKAIFRWTVIILIAAIVAAYVLMCAFFLLISWVANDYKSGCIGWGMATAGSVIIPAIGRLFVK